MSKFSETRETKGLQESLEGRRKEEDDLGGGSDVRWLRLQERRLTSIQ